VKIIKKANFIEKCSVFPEFEKKRFLNVIRDLPISKKVFKTLTL